jgi:prepilin-type N-terminal cleavage/methylation domain-containing protein
MNSNKGFTLLEMIFSMAIIGILLGTLLINFTDYYRSLNTGQFAEAFATDISYARDFSSARDKGLRATFDRDLRTYHFELIPPDPSGNLFLPGTAAREGSFPPGFTLAFTGSNPLQVTFNEQGIPLVPGDIILNLTAGDVTRTITINHKTGLLTIG